MKASFQIRSDDYTEAGKRVSCVAVPILLEDAELHLFFSPSNSVCAVGKPGVEKQQQHTSPHTRADGNGCSVFEVSDTHFIHETCTIVTN